MLYRTMCAVVRVAMIVHVVCLSRAMPVFILRCRLAISRRRRPSSARSSCAHVRVESCTVGVWAGARPVTSCTSGHKFIRGVWNGSTHASIEVSSARNRTRAESKSNYATLSLTHVTTSRQRASVSRRGAQSPTAKRNDELSAPRETQWSQVLRKGSANGTRARHSALRSAPIEATPNALHGAQRPARPVPSLGSRLQVNAMAPHVSLPSVRATVAFTIAKRSDVKWQSIVRTALVEELAVVSALGAG